MNFEEKEFQLPIGKMKISNFESTVTIKDGSNIGHWFLVFVFGTVIGIFVIYADEMKKIEINPVILFISAIFFLYESWKMFFTGLFSDKIRLNEIAYISTGIETAGHIYPMTAMTFYRHNGTQRAVWIKQKNTQTMLDYFASIHIEIKQIK
jgi:hypothetical protein